MRVPISNLTVETETGPVVCNEAEVSIAISNSVAMRIVPVGVDGTEYPNAATGVVGDGADADIGVFMDEVLAAASRLLSAKGV